MVERAATPRTLRRPTQESEGATPLKVGRTSSCRVHSIMMTPDKPPRVLTTPPPLGRSAFTLRSAIIAENPAAVKAILEDDSLEAFKPLPLHSAGWELPLHFALAVGSSPEVVDVLLTHNANANEMNSNGLTALCIIACARLAAGTRERADTNPMDGLPAWLRRDIGSSGPSFHRPRAESCPGAFANETHEAMWKHLVPPLALQRQSPSPCVEASASLRARMTDDRRSALTQILLNHGADPSQRDKSGRLPSEYAALTGHDVLVNLLAEHSRGAELA